MKGGAADAAAVSDVVKNTYGWNVMKPDVIDDELWNDIYDTYVADKNRLGVREHFKDVNPAAVQEMTAVMMETARKGMWHASPEQLRELAKLHTETVKETGAACSGFVCDNAKLRDFISSKVDGRTASEYNKEVAEVRAENASGAGDGMVMKREEMNPTETVTNHINGIIVGAVVLLLLIGLALLVRRRKKNIA